MFKSPLNFLKVLDLRLYRDTVIIGHKLCGTLNKKNIVKGFAQLQFTNNSFFYQNSESTTATKQ